MLVVYPVVTCSVVSVPLLSYLALTVIPVKSSVSPTLYTSFVGAVTSIPINCFSAIVIVFVAVLLVSSFNVAVIIVSPEFVNVISFPTILFPVDVNVYLSLVNILSPLFSYVAITDILDKSIVSPCLYEVSNP